MRLDAFLLQLGTVRLPVLRAVERNWYDHLLGKWELLSRLFGLETNVNWAILSRKRRSSTFF